MQGGRNAAVRLAGLCVRSLATGHGRRQQSGPLLGRQRIGARGAGSGGLDSDQPLPSEILERPALGSDLQHGTIRPMSQASVSCILPQRALRR